MLFITYFFPELPTLIGGDFIVIILQWFCWNIKLYKVVGVILIENRSDILFHRDNRFGIIVTGGYSSEEFGLGSVCLTQNPLIKMGEVLVSLTPGEIVGAGLTWLVWPWMPGSLRDIVHPQTTWMLVPTIKTCARGCFVRLRWLLGVSGDHPRPFGLWKGWTACPLRVLGSKTVGRHCVRSVDGPWGPIMPELSFLKSSTGGLALSRLTEIGWNHLNQLGLHRWFCISNT